MPDHDLVNLFANLELAVGDNARQLAENNRVQKAWLNARRAETPRYQRIHGSLTIPSTGVGILQFDNQPSQGRTWLVRKLLVGGLTPTTTVAGRADVYVSAADYRRYTTLAEIGVQDWCDQATSLPLAGTYSRGELVVQQGEQLWIVFSSATAGQEYTAQGLVEDWQDAAYQAEWGG